MFITISKELEEIIEKKKQRKTKQKKSCLKKKSFTNKSFNKKREERKVFLRTKKRGKKNLFF